MQEKQAWVTCLLTDILLTYLEDTAGAADRIDYPGLFRGLEGFEMPADPAAFLRDPHNWVPLPLMRRLQAQCEQLTGRKDMTYHAARSYFDPARAGRPSIFQIIPRILNDVRAVVICSSLFSAVQTNYLRAQACQRSGPPTDLYLLCRFDQIVRPTVGAMNFLRGICEGFPRLLAFIHEVHCVEEISQLRIEDVVHEFPDFALRTAGEEVSIHRHGSGEPVVVARRVPLRSERLALMEDFPAGMRDVIVVPPEDGTLEVLTPLEETDQSKAAHAPRAYAIIRPGALSHDTLSYAFLADQVYNAPYSRFRFAWKGTVPPPSPPSGEAVRREVSQLLFDYLQHIKQTHMRMIQEQIEKRTLRLENIQLRREMGREYSFAGLVGQSDQMQRVHSAIRSVAETDVTVLIQGETGTGKELIARAIHYNSPRRERRFVAINCGALSETLLESELFGHEKGAFTGAIAQRKGVFEQADGGTLFLDEIGEVAPSTQVKLLRVLQESEFQRVGGTGTLRVDVRIVAATNQSVEELVKKGQLRQDLYYRLNVFPMKVPPLRERTEDIPLLVSHFLEKRRRSLGKEIEGASPAAMGVLMAYSWPGNARELENTIQRMMVVAKKDILDLQDLPEEIRGAGTGPQEEPRGLKGIARESAGMVEKQAILDALAKTGGNVTRAAKLLGVSRATLQNKMKAYGLRHPKP